jgi:hypothetical protein
MNKVFGSLIASAVAGIVASAPALANEPAKEAGHKMACQNNSCKGKAACKGFGNNACMGHNECKGHGILKAKDEASCKKAGGVWTESK